MKKEYSAFKTTILLYIIVLILPFGFYYVNTSFQTIQRDTKIVHYSSWLGNAISRLVINDSRIDTKQTIQQIDTAMEEISQWVSDNKHTSLYIGATSIEKDFLNVKNCWEACKQSYSTQQYKKLQEQVIDNITLLDTFSVNIEKMVYLKEDKMINVFYITFMLIMILMLISIYSIRLFIEHQLKKQAIHDHDTQLFNKKYFMAELTSSCARATRYNYPLSIFSLAITNLKDEVFNQKDQLKILGEIGTIIGSHIRASDVAARYDNNHIIIMLPFTEVENVKILEDRIEEALVSHHFHVTPKPEFVFSTVFFKEGDSPEACVEKAQALLLSQNEREDNN